MTDFQSCDNRNSQWGSYKQGFKYSYIAKICSITDLPQLRLLLIFNLSTLQKTANAREKWEYACKVGNSTAHFVSQVKPAQVNAGTSLPLKTQAAKQCSIVTAYLSSKTGMHAITKLL